MARELNVQLQPQPELNVHLQPQPEEKLIPTARTDISAIQNRLSRRDTLRMLGGAKLIDQVDAKDLVDKAGSD